MNNHDCLALMGIDVWVERNCGPIDDQASYALTLIVSPRAKDNPNCLKLLQQILFYLKQPLEHCQLLSTQQAQTLTPPNTTPIIKFSSEHLEGLGSNAIHTICLTELLQAPQKKQQVLYDIAKLAL